MSVILLKGRPVSLQHLHAAWHCGRLDRQRFFQPGLRRSQ